MQIQDFEKWGRLGGLEAKPQQGPVTKHMVDVRGTKPLALCSMMAKPPKHLTQPPLLLYGHLYGCSQICSRLQTILKALHSIPTVLIWCQNQYWR